jgi:SAM-dependent methyltransferase
MIMCPVCNSCKWVPYIDTSKGKLITGDQRIIEGNISKVMCDSCYAVKNKEDLTNKELELFYGDEYELNTLGREEHYFFTDDGYIARSKAFFDWILPHLPEGSSSLLEVGCGEGNLLSWFSSECKNIVVEGIDGSEKAVKLAKNKGLCVSQGFITGKEAGLDKMYDTIVLVNVIEHVNDISAFISVLKKSVFPKGRIIMTLPIQDFGGYDIFFAEHVWHFLVKHFVHVLKRNGLDIIFSDVEHPINHGIGLFVCEVSEGDSSVPCVDFFESDRAKLDKVGKYWFDLFKRMDDMLALYGNKKIAVFGSGEVFTLLMAFTGLSTFDVVVCIDETKEKHGNVKHGINIHGLEWFEENLFDVIILAVHPKYNDLVKSKLESQSVDILLLS